MNLIFKLILSLSISASILAIILFSIKPFVKDKLSKAWQYYIWFIVIIRLVIPYTSNINMVGTMFNWVESKIAVQNETLIKEELKSQAEIIEQDEALYRPEDNYDSGNESSQGNQSIEKELSSKQPVNYLSELKNNIWLLWLGIACLLFVHKATSYHSFVRYMKSGRYKVYDISVLESYKEICSEMGLKKPLSLYINKVATSPMLVGIYKPFIVLPDLNVSKQELHNILLHELIHYKRKDIIYKWITQISVCLHWFNPLVYFISKEINNNCELSCDEAIIKKLDENERRNYGDTLLASLKFGGNYSDTIVPITLNEDARRLKERLVAIMKYGKKTKQTVSFTIILTVFMLCGTVFTGAYAASTSTNNVNKEVSSKSLKKTSKSKVKEEVKHENENTIIDIQSQNSYNIAESGSFQVDSDQTLSLSITSNIKGGTVDLFLLDPNGEEKRITIGSKDFTKKIKVTKGLWAYTCSGIFKEGGRIHITGTIVEGKTEKDTEKETEKDTEKETEEETEEETNDFSAIDTTKEKTEPTNNNNLIDIQSQNSYNIAESGSFQVDSNQKMLLSITSDIKGGTVDLFLFDPNGKEQRITIGSKDFTKKIKVTKGLWAYNCSGIFKDGGNIHIIGTVKE